MKTQAWGPVAPPKPTEIDALFLRKLKQLCHPDRHQDSPLSKEVFQRLNEIGKELDKKKQGA